MANDDLFTATTTWQPVQISAADITNGTFTVFNRDREKVELLKSDTLPAQPDKGSTFMKFKQDSIKVTLGATEKLFCRTGAGTAILGVIPA